MFAVVAIMIWAVLFMLVAASLVVAVLIGIVMLAYVYALSGGRGLERDGLARGAVAPTWSLTALSGAAVESPPRHRQFQLIVFTDHSLKSFPSVAEGLRALVSAASELEIVVLMRQPSNLAEPVLRVLGLGGVPVLAGSASLYGKYNVRVMPFVVFVDAHGSVCASSLVNHSWQVERLWRLARVAPISGESGLTGRSRRRLARVGV